MLPWRVLLVVLGRGKLGFMGGSSFALPASRVIYARLMLSGAFIFNDGLLTENACLAGSHAIALGLRIT